MVPIVSTAKYDRYELRGSCRVHEVSNVFMTRIRSCQGWKPSLLCEWSGDIRVLQ